jgi:hypothetical protein
VERAEATTENQWIINEKIKGQISC